MFSIKNSFSISAKISKRGIPRYTQRIAEYQEQTIQTIKDIAFDFIEAEKQVIGSFQSHLDRKGYGICIIHKELRKIT